MLSCCVRYPLYPLPELVVPISGTLLVSFHPHPQLSQSYCPLRVWRFMSEMKIILAPLDFGFLSSDVLTDSIVQKDACWTLSAVDVP